MLYKLTKNSELRTKYKSVIAKAKKENVPHILFHKFDSEARNLTDNKTNEELIRSGKVVIRYIADQKVLHKASP